MELTKHMPRVIEQPFPLFKETKQPEAMADCLWLPEQLQSSCPLIVRVTTGEAVQHEVQALTAAGFAVYICFADQLAMELDLEACAAWQETLEQKLDALLTDHPELDAERLFVDGWITAFLISRTHRFQAAVQRPALLHRATAFGNCLAGETAFSAEPLLEQMKQLAKQSILALVDNCKTPCLVLYQEGNLRYSREQSEQFYAAMKDRNGEIACRMVVLPNNSLCDWQQVCREELICWWKRFPGKRRLPNDGKTTSCDGRLSEAALCG